jgi:hypothetical protein
MFLFSLLSVMDPAHAGAEASAFRRESRKPDNYWNASAAIDGNPQTAWMVPGESENKGEWIEIQGPIGFSTLEEIGMVVGFARDEESFKDYARIKQMRVEVFEFSNSMELQPTGRSTTVDFEDKMGMQIVDIEDLEIKSEGGGKYKLVVSEIYEGKDYPNFAISEMLLYMKDFDVVPQITEEENGAEGSESLDMVDDNSKTFWTANEGAKIGFESGTATISRVGIKAGPSTYARPKTVKVSSGGREVVQEVPNDSKTHWIWTPSVTGYSGSTFDTVYVEVVDTYPGSKHQEVAISELDAKATSAGL